MSPPPTVPWLPGSSPGEPFLPLSMAGGTWPASRWRRLLRCLPLDFPRRGRPPRSRLPTSPPRSGQGSSPETSETGWVACTHCPCDSDPGRGLMPPALPSLRLSSSEHSPSCLVHSGEQASSVWSSACSCSGLRDRAVSPCSCPFPWSWGSSPWGCLSPRLPSLLADHHSDSALHALGSCLSQRHSPWAVLGVAVWATVCSADWGADCGPPSSCLPAVPICPKPGLFHAGG